MSCFRPHETGESPVLSTSVSRLQLPHARKRKDEREERDKEEAAEFEMLPGCMGGATDR